MRCGSPAWRWADSLYSGAASAELQESPQHFAIEIKFGPYVPHLDDVPWLNRADAVFFTSAIRRTNQGRYCTYGLLRRSSSDYQFWGEVGIFAIGLESGYAASAPAYTIPARPR